MICGCEQFDICASIAFICQCSQTVSETRQVRAHHWDFITRLYNGSIELFDFGHRGIASRTPSVDQDLHWNVVDKNISYSVRATAGCHSEFWTGDAVFLEDRRTFRKWPFLLHALQTTSCAGHCDLAFLLKPHEAKLAAAKVPVFSTAEFDLWVSGPDSEEFDINAV